MSRFFEQYSPEEKVNVLSFSIQNKKEQIDDLNEKVWMLETELGILLESIRKLPRKERELLLRGLKDQKSYF